MKLPSGPISRTVLPADRAARALLKRLCESRWVPSMTSSSAGEATESANLSGALQVRWPKLPQIDWQRTVNPDRGCFVVDAIEKAGRTTPGAVLAGQLAAKGLLAATSADHRLDRG